MEASSTPPQGPADADRPEVVIAGQPVDSRMDTEAPMATAAGADANGGNRPAKVCTASQPDAQNPYLATHLTRNSFPGTNAVWNTSYRTSKG